MIHCFSSSSNVAVAQGPISGDLQLYAQRLSELVCKLPDGDFAEARRMLHGIFDGIARVAGLEKDAVIPLIHMTHSPEIRRCRVCGRAEPELVGVTWWVRDDLCAICSDTIDWSVPQ